MRKLSILLAINAFAIFSYSQNIEFQAPIAKRIADTNILHNDTIIDYYSWLKHKDSIDVLNYLYAENAYADNVMKGTRLLQKKLYEEFLSRIRENFVSIPFKEKGYVYYTKYEKGKEFPLNCRKVDTLGAKEEIYLDINEISKQYSYASVLFSTISPNQKTLAYCLNTIGGDAGQVFFKDLSTDSILQDQLSNVSSLIWGNDNQTVYYIKEDKKTKKANKVFKHILGTSEKDDKLLYHETKPGYYPGLGKSTSERFIFLTVGSMLSSYFYVLDANNPRDTFKLYCPEIPKCQYGLDHFYKEDTEFWITTNWKAPNFRILKAPLNPTPKEKWNEFLAHRRHVSLEGFYVFKDYILFSELDSGITKIRLQDRNNSESKYLRFNEDIYSCTFQGIRDKFQDKFVYSYTSLKTPFELHEYDLTTNKDSIILIDTVEKYNPNLYKTERIWALSHDSVKVPIDIVYRKDLLKKDGGNPVYLYAYACYGNNMLPSFSKNILSYLNRGFVYALAHPRGESLLGKEWHTKGKLLYKKNTYLDFIACAEHLIENKYTSPKKIAIQGGSAGGMLVGAVVTMRPDLFKAAIADVPFVDVLNDMQDTSWSNIVYHYDEIGNPNIKEQYDSIKDWCPYQNVKSIYPDLLVTAGFNDSRVPCRAPAKWVAKMRHNKKDSTLLLLKTNMDAGHFGMSGRYKGLKENAFKMAFLMKSLGFKEDYIVVKGKVIDANGSPLPYVNVYLKGTTHGTTSNFDGDFALEVRKDQPKAIVFQYIGFKKKTIELKAEERTDDWVVELESEHILLQEVEIHASDKDPAYRIIKNAQDKRKEYLKRVNSYSNDIYIKGSARLNEIPEKFPFFFPKDEMPDSTDLGLISFSECVTKYNYQKPDNYKEEMIASKVAGMKQGYSWNRASDVTMNFYENQVEIPLSPRPFITPISSQALFYYKFKLIESIYEEGKFVYKIEVIPRRKADPIFSGNIYINDNEWSIHSVDLTIGKETQVEFTDSINYKQVYLAMEDSTSMPLSLYLSHYFKAFGFDVTGSYVSFFSNYKINRTFPEGFFRNEVFKIEKEANKRDSLYWEETRPVMLTNEEEKHYQHEDSLYERRQSKDYLDSVDRKYNKMKLMNVLLTGYRYYNRANKQSFYINSIAGGLAHYNTVEGFTFNIRPTWYKGFEDPLRRIVVRANIRYSEARNSINASTKVNYYWNYKKFQAVSLYGGQEVRQYNNHQPIPEFFNTVYTLFARENYAKYYEKTFLTGKFRREITNGLVATSGLEFQERNPLTNHEDFSLFFKDEKDFLSNNPLDPSNDDPAFAKHQAYIFDLRLNIRIKQKFESYPDFKRVIGSKYPEFTVYYKKGLNAFNSKVNFDYLEAAIGDDMNLKQFGISKYDFVFGGFLNNSGMSFIDYKHFNGNQTHILNYKAPSYFLGDRTPLQFFHGMDYYTNSTMNYFLEGHYEHHFKGWVLNKLPFIRKTKLQALAGANFLYTKENKEYTELFVGVENIFKFLRLDLVTHYQNDTKIEPELRIGISLGPGVSVSGGDGF